jgi:hypothetical protein
MCPNEVDKMTKATTVTPMPTVSAILTVYLGMGGKTANPALANAPMTKQIAALRR